MNIEHHQLKTRIHHVKKLLSIQLHRMIYVFLIFYNLYTRYIDRYIILGILYLLQKV